MQKFKYTAINRAGQHTSGEIESTDMQTARLALSEQGKFVSDITAVNSDIAIKQSAPAINTNIGPASVATVKLSNREKNAFVNQFATALRAKVPIMGALEVVASQNPSKKVVLLVNSLTRQIRGGSSLSEAMRSMGNTFDRLDISLVEIGESAGNLDECVTRLAEVNTREMEV